MNAPGRFVVSIAVLGLMGGIAAAQPPHPEPEHPAPHMGPPEHELAQMERRAEEMTAEAERIMHEAERLAASGRAPEHQVAQMRRRAEEMRRHAEAVRRELRSTGDLYALAGDMGSGEPPVIIVAPEMPEPELEAVGEDMRVMARILHKALRHELGEAALPGGEAVFMPDGRADRRQSAYLAGYGALFVVQVRFPLAGPAGPEPPRREREPGSLWQETRRELREPRRPMREFPMHVPEHRRHGGGYDPERVEHLRAVLLDALRHAANIRALAPEDAVVVAVLGAPAPGRAATVLTMRVQRADVDALAAEEIAMEEFAERVAVSIR